ncbi:hypothetical protein CDL12_05725 [Handroanthus impetiginosus]|uniref:Retrotransposon Copia-like N-terminal domain-containing protein n=1 Tax=Handroanthus impetiginosus TaxID=429701 RepID=A0A2G9HVN4_9LAMI|nr:hypothetical protein CDL12_05725 [Handroanthus impetiginosus]
MSNLTKLEFEALDITGKNYLSWVLDAEIHLDAKGLGATIIAGNEISNQDKAKKTVILPKARYDWMYLRLQDFKTVSDYNSAIFKISSQLKLCGEKITDEDLLEKTFSTFHASNVLLQQQYREKSFKKYAELISCLLVAEQNNELLMKNQEARPTGSAPFPEVNAAIFNKSGGGQNHGHNNTRGRGRGHGNDCSRNNYRYRSGNDYNSNHQKWINNDEKEKDKSGQSNPSKDKENGHWSRTCRTPKHLVKLYQDFIKGKNAGTNFTHHNNNSNYDVEVNFAYKDDDFKGLTDITHLDVADFFESHEERTRDENNI